MMTWFRTRDETRWSGDSAVDDSHGWGREDHILQEHW